MNADANSGKSILYIEDDVVVLTAYRDRLQKAGFEVESSVDGLEAMHMLAMREFDLIILDLMLPHFGGADILKAVRDNPRLKSIPVVIFCTNLDVAPPHVLKLADGLLLKGECTFQNLLQTIKDLLAKSHDAGNG